MISIANQLLITSISVSLQGANPDQLVRSLKDHRLDWETMVERASYHGIIPVLFDAWQRMDSACINQSVFETIRKKSLQQSIRSLALAREVVELIALLKGHKIQAIPFKGVIFENELYANRSLRAGNDLDILVRRSDVPAALQILLATGTYRLLLPQDYLKQYPVAELIDRLLKAKGYHEVGLVHNLSSLHIDFHWDLYEDTYQYEVPLELVFANLQQKPFFSTLCDVPSREALFWMLLIHHGGRELWMRLKYICDLLQFYRRYEHELNWESLIKDAESYRLKQVMISGFYCLKKYFSISLHPAIQANFANKSELESLTNLLEISWERSLPRNSSFLAKIHAYRLFFKLQDSGFSYGLHGKQSFLKRATLSPLEPEKRIIQFSPKYKFFNFLGKLVSALLIYVGVVKRVSSKKV